MPYAPLAYALLQPSFAGLFKKAYPSEEARALHSIMQGSGSA
jgi:hypothetical protein